MFEETPSFLNVVTIRIPGRKEDGQAVQLTIRNDTTAEQLLATVSEVCYPTKYLLIISHTFAQKFKLNVANHFVRLKHTTKEGSTCTLEYHGNVIVLYTVTFLQISFPAAMMS